MNLVALIATLVPRSVKTASARIVRRRLLALAATGALVTSGAGVAAAHDDHEFHALVFSKVTNFYHESIPAGIDTIEQLGAEHNFGVTVTDDSSIFNADDLATFDVVIFNNTNSTPTSGDLLNADERAAFVDYIQAGGGWVGLHSASGSERDWDWYEGLVGAIFTNHPPGQNPDGTIPGRVNVTDRVHPSTQHLPEVWRYDEEWYNFNLNVSGRAHVLATIDTKTGIQGLQMGTTHPFSWCQNYDGGRSWYTAGGHSPAAFSDDDYVRHLLGGIQWAAGAAQGECGATVEGNFEKVLLDGDLEDPMQVSVADDGRVFVIERTGALKVWDPATNQTSTAGTLDVLVAHTHGLNGLAVDPGFTDNNWVYLYYSPTGEDHHRLSRFTMDGNTLDMSSEIVMLQVPAQRDVNAHEAGGMAWDEDGNLFLSTGDNSQPTQYTPIDERPGQEHLDAQRSSANTNDLRGKILRIHPEPDGTYTVPDGNLFAGDDSGQTRPEIYTMGHRQPYRIHYDDVSGRLLWGDVGPDAHTFSDELGPMGFDEFFHTTEPGNFGWPHCRGGEAYRDFDFTTGTAGEPFDCAGGPGNDSPNNTGLEQLPPVNDPQIWYPYDWANYPGDAAFPELGNGGRLALGGPVYRYDPDLESDTKFPEYYDGKWFIAEWIRGWIKTASIAETDLAFDDYPDVSTGDVYSIDPFLDSQTFLRPHDMVFGPEGSMYMLEWGTNYGGAGRGDPNDDSGLYRIDYVKGARSPVAVATGTPDNGQAPLTVEFSSEGTHHPDNLPFTMEWDFGDGTTSTEPNPAHTYTEPGEYTAQLVVVDGNDRSAFANVRVVAGNTRPIVTIETPLHGGFVEDGQVVPFDVTVDDAEDGSTAEGTIDCSRVEVQPWLGHDEHAHPLDVYQGCSGEFEVSLDEGHAWHDNYWYLLDASYADDGAPGTVELTGGDEVTLQPKRKQAEHFTDASGVQVVQMGPDEGSEQQPGGAVVGHVSDGDWVAYDPIDLTGIDDITIHGTSASVGGTIELRANSPDGPLVADPVNIPRTGDDWRANFVDVSTSVTNAPDGPFTLYLVFAGDPAQDLMNVHWMIFGEGAGQSGVLLTGIEADPVWRSGQESTVTVSALNHEAETQADLTVTVDVPDGWSASEADVTVPPGESASVDLTVTSAVAPATATLTPVATDPELEISGSPTADVLTIPNRDDTLVAFDGGAAASPVFESYTQLSPADTWTSEVGFGWVDASPDVRDRGLPDDLRRDFVGTPQTRTLRVDVPAGDHTAFLLRGDNGFPAHPMTVAADGDVLAEGGALGAGQYEWVSFPLDGGDDGQVVDLTLSGQNGQWWHLNGLVAMTCPEPDTRETVMIGDVDTTVPSGVAEQTGTVNDLIRDEDQWPDHGSFVAHVDDVTSALVADGIVSDREKGEIMRVAGQSPIGKDVPISARGET